MLLKDDVYLNEFYCGRFNIVCLPTKLTICYDKETKCCQTLLFIYLFIILELSIESVGLLMG